VRLDDSKNHFFGARRANVAGLGALAPRAEELALPKSVECGNLSFSRTGIRWMSAKSLVSAPFRAFRRLSQITVKYMMLEKRPRETRRPFAPRIQGFGVGSQNCNLELSNAHIRVEESYDSSGAPVSLTRHSPTRGAI
jgi:hypothetical protein